MEFLNIGFLNNYKVHVITYHYITDHSKLNKCKKTKKHIRGNQTYSRLKHTLEIRSWCQIKYYSFCRITWPHKVRHVYMLPPEGAQVSDSAQGLLIACRPLWARKQKFANSFACMSILIKILWSCRNNLVDARVYLTHHRTDHYWHLAFPLESNSQSLFLASPYSRRLLNRPLVRKMDCWLSLTFYLYPWIFEGGLRKGGKCNKLGKGKFLAQTCKTQWGAGEELEARRHPRQSRWPQVTWAQGGESSWPTPDLGL